MPQTASEVRVAHTGDVHLEEDRYFGDTAQCLEWFVCDGIRAGVDLFVINGDLTTYKATIKERNLWIDMLIRMADHAPVIVTAGNHGRELTGDLYVYSRAKGKHAIRLCTEPEFVEVGEFAVGVFPYPRKAELMGTAGEAGFQAAFAEQINEFGRQFAQRPDRYKLFFGHFGVAGARVSSGQPLAGRCAEYPLEPLRTLAAQYVGLSHIHLRHQLAPRVWYCGSLSRCDYSETEEKGYHLVRLSAPELRPDSSDLNVEFRASPTRSMIEIHLRYENGEFQLPKTMSTERLKDSRVKVVVTVAEGAHQKLGRDAQEDLRERLLAAGPAELKLKIEREAEGEDAALPVSQAHSAEGKLRAYWEIKGAPPADEQARLLAKLAHLEARLYNEEQR
ncbi:MAG: metallophosphoesterase [Chloroflexi bacterium]|nr:metallophosphoesterase [Chloroflexota bacterium]